MTKEVIKAKMRRNDTEVYVEVMDGSCMLRVTDLGTGEVVNVKRDDNDMWAAITDVLTPLGWEIV